MSFAGFLDIARKDVDVPAKAPKELLLPQHVQFIDKYMRDKEGYEYVMAEPLRVSGIYWCLSALDIMGELSRADTDGIAAYMCECRREDGGYAPAPQHDSHLLHTLSAVQVLVLLERRDLIDADAVAGYVKARFNQDGSFTGDGANEVDTRFSMCALATLHLIDRMDVVDVDKTARFVMSCYNPDGGFGTRPGSESHAGQVYCCVGALKLAGWLEAMDRERTAEWLAQRQCASGGLNGRPEKLPDVCYSWWILASLHMLGRLANIDEVAMRRFIFACQDDETGGFADRPGDYPDPFHTVFGVAALSLLGGEGAKGLEDVDSLLCMPKNKLHAYATC